MKKIGEYWIWGKHTVLAALNNKSRVVKELIITRQTMDDLKNKFNFDLLSIPIRYIERSEFDRVLSIKNVLHQGIALKVLPLAQPEFKNFFNSFNSKFSTIVVIDQINDPHNLGAILRSCAAFNVDAVLIPKDNAVSETSVVTKSSCGGIEVVPLISVSNIAETLKVLKNKGYWVAGLDINGTASFAAIESIEKMVMVFGSEGEGMRKLTREHCDFIISIPMSNKVESINLSNAVAISLYKVTQKIV
jgi:23S rRNA (guanosine2251-2'-O)-methyltransferase